MTNMIEIALYEPEIPSNTGNIIRLCANAGAKLHLIHPLGFDLESKKLRRAGLDYHEFVAIVQHKNFEEFIEKTPGQCIWACTTKANQYYHRVKFKNSDILLLGPETRGFPQGIKNFFLDSQIKLPMVNKSRSLNLSNTAAIMLFEAWRQINFTGVTKQ